jgi:hypothetical protein
VPGEPDHEALVRRILDLLEPALVDDRAGHALPSRAEDVEARERLLHVASGVDEHDPLELDRPDLELVVDARRELGARQLAVEVALRDPVEPRERPAHGDQLLAQTIRRPTGRSEHVEFDRPFVELLARLRGCEVAEHERRQHRRETQREQEPRGQGAQAHRRGRRRRLRGPGHDDEPRTPRGEAKDLLAGRSGRRRAPSMPLPARRVFEHACSEMPGRRSAGRGRGAQPAGRAQEPVLSAAGCCIARSRSMRSATSS